MLLPIGIFLHAVWGTIIWFAFLVGNDNRKAFYTVDKNTNCSTIDAIHYAGEIGRLDLISLLLALFGIIIAIMAIGWFGYIRTEAKQEARDEIRECGGKIINEWIQNNPDIIIRALQDSSLNTNQINVITSRTQANIADEIATAISNIQREGEQNE